jgi:hypothetical protein
MAISAAKAGVPINATTIAPVASLFMAAPQKHAEIYHAAWGAVAVTARWKGKLRPSVFIFIRFPKIKDTSSLHSLHTADATGAATRRATH